jgi:hypothetical protein
MKYMAIVGILGWWYTAGWARAFRKLRATLVSLFDYFSIDLLLRTLFTPFRQISAGSVNGPLNIKLRAWFDKLISRVIGAIVRLLVMMIGVVAIMLTVLGGVVYLALWALMPWLPIVGLTLMLLGWTPWTLV